MELIRWRECGDEGGITETSRDVPALKATLCLPACLAFDDVIAGDIRAAIVTKVRWEWNTS